MDELERKRLLRTIARLKSGLSKDTSRARNRLGIAQCFEKLGDSSEAVRWYLEASRFAEYCENAYCAQAILNGAQKMHPENKELRDEAIKHARKWGLNEQ